MTKSNHQQPLAVAATTQKIWSAPTIAVVNPSLAQQTGIHGALDGGGVHAEYSFTS